MQKPLAPWPAWPALAALALACAACLPGPSPGSTPTTYRSPLPLSSPR